MVYVLICSNAKWRRNGFKPEIHKPNKQFQPEVMSKINTLLSVKVDALVHSQARCCIPVGSIGSLKAGSSKLARLNSITAW